MSELADKIRKTVVYNGPSKAERSVWNKAIEEVCLVVDEWVPPTHFPIINKEEEE